MSIKKRFLAVAGTVAIFFGGAGVAYANTSGIGGQLNTSGSLVKYDYTRTHTFSGPITLSVTNMPSGYLRLGLRNMKQPGGPQFSDTIKWNTTGTRSWEGVRKGTRFAFQGRMKQCSWWCDNSWGGTLTY